MDTPNEDALALTPEQSEAIDLYYRRFLSATETAAIMGFSVGELYEFIYSALDALEAFEASAPVGSTPDAPVTYTATSPSAIARNDTYAFRVDTAASDRLSKLHSVPRSSSSHPDFDWVSRALTFGRRRRSTSDDAVAASPQRVRDHLRRPIPGRRNYGSKPPETVSKLVPRCTAYAVGCWRFDQRRTPTIMSVVVTIIAGARVSSRRSTVRSSGGAARYSPAAPGAYLWPAPHSEPSCVASQLA